MNKPRILFMGTPAFAVASLDALVEAGHEVVGVITAPDRPAGRGRKLRASAIKERALELGLPALQPERLKAPDFLTQLEHIDADLQIVVAFRMLPQVVWSRPKLGTVNLHASLLPDYRGAAPINHAIINGEQHSGVTTFLIQQEIDTGDILLQEVVDIGPDETAGELHDRMMIVGATLIVRTVDGLAQGTLSPVPQKAPDQLHAAPKIDPAHCRIDVGAPAQRVHDLIRGMSPVPGAWCELHGATDGSMHFKVLRSARTMDVVNVPPGTVRVDGVRMFIACKDLWLEALEVQPEGRRRMHAAEFTRGLRRLDALRIA